MLKRDYKFGNFCGALHTFITRRQFESRLPTVHSCSSCVQKWTKCSWLGGGGGWGWGVSIPECLAA